MGMDTGNPFVDGWLDLTDTVSGGGKDLGVSELAEKLGKDVYMDINGWCVSLCPQRPCLFTHIFWISPSRPPRLSSPIRQL